MHFEAATIKNYSDRTFCSSEEERIKIKRSKIMGDFMQSVAAMACIKSLLMIFNLAFWVSFVVYFQKTRLEFFVHFLTTSQNTVDWTTRLHQMTLSIFRTDAMRLNRC